MSTETNNNDFEKLLPLGPEPVARLEARVALLSKRRKGSSSANAALDRFLLESYAKLSDRSSSLDRQLNEVRDIQTQLREALDQATSPSMPSKTSIASAARQ